MDLRRIATLLQPFLASPVPGRPAVLSELQLRQISTYLDMLLRWNSRINLTSVREADAIVARHFGESLFTARHLYPSAVQAGSSSEHPRVLDFGSGAGFPGLPIKIWSPHVDLTLIESNQKKATFLREVIRRLSLNSVVFAGRAEDFRGQAETVTLRAVERFESSVPVAARLLSAEGRLALLIGISQVARTRELVPNIRWLDPVAIPISLNRVLLIGSSRSAEEESN
jgi:16S rRNA (guanine527-N7)-methyltransferase